MKLVSDGFKTLVCRIWEMDSLLWRGSEFVESDLAESFPGWEFFVVTVCPEFCHISHPDARAAG